MNPRKNIKKLDVFGKKKHTTHSFILEIRKCGVTYICGVESDIRNINTTQPFRPFINQYDNYDHNTVHIEVKEVISHENQLFLESILESFYNTVEMSMVLTHVGADGFPLCRWCLYNSKIISYLVEPSMNSKEIGFTVSFDHHTLTYY